MADARLKEVMTRLADLHSERDFAVDLGSTNLSDDVGVGDVLDIPDITALTVIADGDTDTAGETVTTNITALNVNLNPWINARLPQRAAHQLLKGNWASEVARTGYQNLRNSIDSTYLTYLVTNAWTTGTAATHHTNVAGDTLTSADILNAMATLTNNRGVSESDLVLFMSAYGAASIRSVATFVPNYTEAERGNLGIPKIGSIHGVPIYQTSAVPRLRTVAATASSITSNVLTCTVAAGHGLIAGQLITTAGGTADVDTAAAITSTTATTVVVPLTACNDASNGALTITADDSENVMIARNHNYTARQVMPTSRIVADPDSSGDMLQISMIWGRVGRVGYANVIHSPQTSI